MANEGLRRPENTQEFVAMRNAVTEEAMTHKLTGMLVHSIEGCAYQIRYLLTHPEFAAQLGRNGREHVKENFLMTTNVRRWLMLLQILLRGGKA